MVLANILQPLIDFFEAILKFFHDPVGLGWGAAIIAMTVVIRAALLPLTLKQMRSMQELARHQPELKRLQQKYKDDKERLNQEMMRFYRENKINPFASCLPLLAQIPVFISLFYMLRTDLRYDICPEKNLNPDGSPKPDPAPCGETNASEFFFIPDLTNKATGSVLIALIILYVGSQLLSTILSSMTADRTQRILFMALPFVFVPFILSFPAGLLVYWITTNVWTIGQGVYVRRKVGPMRPPADGDGDGGEKATGWRAMLGIHPPPAVATAGAASGAGEGRPKGRATAPPPPPPRKKKKRSGRRR